MINGLNINYPPPESLWLESNNKILQSPINYTAQSIGTGAKRWRGRIKWEFLEKTHFYALQNFLNNLEGTKNSFVVYHPYYANASLVPKAWTRTINFNITYSSVDTYYNINAGQTLFSAYINNNYFYLYNGASFVASRQNPTLVNTATYNAITGVDDVLLAAFRWAGMSTTANILQINANWRNMRLIDNGQAKVKPGIAGGGSADIEFIEVL